MSVTSTPEPPCAWSSKDPVVSSRTSRGQELCIVGDDEARRLVELGESLRIVEVRPEKPATAVERALALMETRQGRATLATRTWNTV